MRFEENLTTDILINGPTGILGDSPGALNSGSLAMQVAIQNDYLLKTRHARVQAVKRTRLDYPSIQHYLFFYLLVTLNGKNEKCTSPQTCSYLAGLAIHSQAEASTMVYLLKSKAYPACTHVSNKECSLLTACETIQSSTVTILPTRGHNITLQWICSHFSKLLVTGYLMPHHTTHDIIRVI